MSEKETKKKDATKIDKAKLYLTVRYEAMKADTDKGKKLLDPKNGAQGAMVYRAVAKSKEPPMFSEILDAVRPQLKGKSADTVERNLRWYVNDLRKKGLLKSLETKEERGA